MPSVNPVSREFQVNASSSGGSSHPSAALLSNGNYVVVWYGGGPAVAARIVGPDGVPIGGDLVLKGSQAHFPSMDALAGGGFVVGWDDGPNIWAQIFANDGTQLGGEFMINTTVGAPSADIGVGASFVDIAALTDGGFVATWTLFNPPYTSPHVMAQRFAADGTRIGTEFQVEPIGSIAGGASVAGLTGGGFAVAFTVDVDKFAHRNIQVQIFDSAGQRVGSEIPIDFGADGDHLTPEIAALPNDGFVVTWRNESAPGTPTNLIKVDAQVFGAGGVPQSAVFTVNDHPYMNQSNGLTIQGFDDGRFFIMWPDRSGQHGDNDKNGIVGQLFDQSGTPIGAEFLINAQTVDDQYYGTITALSGDTFLVSWSSQHTDSALDAKARLFVLATSIPGTGGADNLVGDPENNELLGLGSDDILSGLAGRDFLLGGTGADMLDGGPGIDTADYSGEYGAVRVNLLAGTGLWNAAHGDTLTNIEHVVGTDFADLLFGNLDDNRLAGNDGADGLFGRAGNDLLEGGNGNDILDAEAGNDVLDGGNGNDVLDGGTGADTLDGGIDVDTADYSGEYGAVFIHMPTGRGLWNSAHGDTLSGIDKVIGTNFDDHFWSDNVTNYFTGGDGNDTFVFNARFYQDVITDFAGNGAAAGDTVRFAAGLFAGFADMMAHATQQGSDVAIALDAANVLFLQSVQLADLHSSDFIYG